MLALLKQRNFALLWAGQLFSLTGDWVLRIALPFYVYEVTGSTLATGLMFIVETLPPLLFGSFAGVFVDRWDRRRTLLTADLLRGALLLMLFWSQPGAGLWLIYVVAFAEMTLSQFFAPARNALLPRLVAKDDLIQANSLSATSEALTRLVGPSLGGALLGLAGFGSVVLVDAGTYFLSALFIYGIAVPKNISQEPGEEGTTTAKPSPVPSLWQDWRAGLLLVVGQPSLRGLFLVSIAIFLGQGIISVLLIVFVKEVLHGGALQFGWMATAQGVGTLVGGLLIGHISKQVGPRYLILAGALSAGLLFLVVIHAASLPVALVLLALIGVPVVGLIVSIQTLLQTSVDDSFRGRVFGTYSATVALVTMIGMGAAGTLGDVLGVLPMLSVGSGLFIVAGVAALFTIPRS